MAEEKKKPDLKARLNRGTIAGVQAPATTSSEPAAPPPTAVADIGAPMGYDAPPPPQPTGFGGNDDIAVPDFIKQQMAEKAAAEARAVAERAAAQRAAAEQVRLAAIAADPFSASSNAGAQEVRLVIDDKAVSDSEVGRKNTGAILTTIGVGVLALVAGYLAGDFKNSRDEAAKTIGAIGEIRRAVDATGSAVTTLKDKIDAAAAAAGIQGEEAQPGAQPTAPPRATVDEALVTWFATQSPDPPLGPDAYAGRVGRLRPDLVSKLMRVQVELEQLWRELQRHQNLTSGNNLVIVRNSLAEAQRVRTEYQQVAVVFAPGRGENAPPVMGTLVAPTPDPTDPSAFSVLLGGAPPQRRTLYTTGDLAAPTTISTVLIPVASNAGVIANVVGNLGRPWADYVAKVNRLKTQIDALQNDHHSLGEALTRAGVN